MKLSRATVSLIALSLSLTAVHAAGATEQSARKDPPAQKKAAERPAPAPQSTGTPAGHYQVVAYAGWAQTSIQADFTLRADRSVVDNWSGKTWRWSYDASTRVVTFSGGPYSDATVTFKPAESRHGVLLIKWPDLDEPAWAYRQKK